MIRTRYDTNKSFLLCVHARARGRRQTKPIYGEPSLYSLTTRQGLLHTWVTSPVTDCSDARSLCAQSCGQHGSRVPQWLPKRLGRNTRHTVASVFVQAAQHSSNGRPICAAHKFTQEQVSSDVPPAQKMGDLSRRARAPARLRKSGSVPCMPRKSYAGRVRSRSLQQPSISSTLTAGDDIIADGVSLLNVVRMLGPGESVPTEG